MRLPMSWPRVNIKIRSSLFNLVFLYMLLRPVVSLQSPYTYHTFCQLQPIIKLPDNINNNINALVTWHSPSSDMILPLFRITIPNPQAKQVYLMVSYFVCACPSVMPFSYLMHPPDRLPNNILALVYMLCSQTSHTLILPS